MIESSASLRWVASTKAVVWYRTMPLSRQDCLQLVREIELFLREYDPGSVELVLRALQPEDDPQRYLIVFLKTIRHFYAERSGGTYGPILDRINHFVRLENDGPVRGLSVALSPAEQERYGLEEVNLAEIPDRSEFLRELDRIIVTIIREIGERNVE